MDAGQSVRPSPIAGRWYPGNPQRLAASVDAYISAADIPVIQGEIVAVMAPHAGHIYSGPVAGYAFAALRGKEAAYAAVISPMHHPYPQPLLTTSHRSYQTPLGEVPVDHELTNKLDAALKNRLGFGLTPVTRDEEHSLEIELPFLQRSLKDAFQLLPVMVRDQSLKTTRALGEALAEVLKDVSAILVASTDLSHFYSQTIANELDGELLRRVAEFDPEGVLKAEDEGVGFACGRAAVAAVMWAARGLGADKIQILNYATSGDVTGNFSEVVGYASAVMTRPA
jgi:AmmeMemoRadiSam system protein B